MHPTITSPEDCDQVLREHALIDFVTRAVNALPLLRAGALTWLLSAETPDAGWAEHFGVRTCSLEHQQGTRRDVRRSGIRAMQAALALPPRARAAEFSRLLPASRSEVPRQWASSVARGPEPAQACDDLKDKGRMRAWFRSRGVPVPAGDIVPAHSLDHGALARKVGTPFVAQRPIGSGGDGTYLVRDDADLHTARTCEPAVDRWLISEYVDGSTLNFHGLVDQAGSVGVTRPSLQLAGLSSTGSEFGASCGSDFLAPQRFPPIAIERARIAVEHIGAGLAERGYRGVFGIDLVVRGDSVAVLELNTRPQSSTWLLGEIEREQGCAPLLARHVLERHGRSTSGDHDSTPARGVQLGVRHVGPSSRVVTAPPSGVYALRGHRLVRRRAGFGLLDCSEDECVLVGLPPPGRTIETSASLGTLITRSAVTSEAGTVLNDHGARLTAAFRELFTLSAVEDEEITA